MPTTFTSIWSLPFLVTTFVTATLTTEVSALVGDVSGSAGDETGNDLARQICRAEAIVFEPARRLARGASTFRQEVGAFCLDVRALALLGRGLHARARPHTAERMAALYPQWANTAYRLALVALVLLVPMLLLALMLYVKTPWNTGQLQPVTQPVEFDHRHHVIDAEIDCLYCHVDAERSAHAGVPSTEVCMGCHSQIWNESPLLEPVRRSYFSGKPIRWNRVHDLADFVYFNHAVHVTGGVDCVHCHGRVDRMARVYKAAPLTMGWCLDCHRNPKAYLARAGVVEAETLVGATIQNISDDIPEHGQSITRLTTCTACHR